MMRKRCRGEEKMDGYDGEEEIVEGKNKVHDEKEKEEAVWEEREK
jgi:hypothetical protein